MPKQNDDKPLFGSMVQGVSKEFNKNVSFISGSKDIKQSQSNLKAIDKQYIAPKKKEADQTAKQIQDSKIVKQVESLKDVGFKTTEGILGSLDKGVANLAKDSSQILTIVLLGGGAILIGGIVIYMLVK